MCRTLSLTIFLIAILIGTLGLSYELHRVEASGTIHIRADGSIDPPTAPISTLDNITYTLTGNILSDDDAYGMVVERDNIVIEGGGYALTGNGTGIGIMLWYRSNVTVRNMTISCFAKGVVLGESDNNALYGNNVTGNNGVGIELRYSNNNVLSGNNVLANTCLGIYLDDSCNNNTLSSNNVVNTDIDGDGKVDMRDVGYVARRFMCVSGDLLWDSSADVNGDGKINMMDTGTVAVHFGALAFIPCKYCRALFPQTSVSCPNCGAIQHSE